jgi:hypothetical protein
MLNFTDVVNYLAKCPWLCMAAQRSYLKQSRSSNKSRHYVIIRDVTKHRLDMCFVRYYVTRSAYIKHGMGMTTTDKYLCALLYLNMIELLQCSSKITTSENTNAFCYSYTLQRTKTANLFEQLIKR